MPGSELLRLGFAAEVVDDGAVRARAEEIAARLAGAPEHAARTIKASIRHHVDIDPETWFASEPSAALLSARQLRE